MPSEALTTTTTTATRSKLMTWCRHCTASAQTITSCGDDDDEGRRISRSSSSSKPRFTSCSNCGRVLKDRSLIDKALSTIHDLATAALNLNDSILLTDAHRLFRTTIQKDKERLFSPSRRARTHTAACCLYIALRRHGKPCMLIDLSRHLKVSVYVLGAVFVALSKILSDPNPSSSSLVIIDPSLCMHRISARLLTRKDVEVASTALRILSKSTITTTGNRNWMVMKRSRYKKQIQVLIRLCTAALYVAVNAREEEGRNFSESQVCIAVCAELESVDCESSRLNVEEFVSMAAKDVGNDSPEEELVCQHRNGDRAHFCNGLCRECYNVFLEICGGRELSEPEKKREMKHGKVLVPLRSSNSASDLEDRDICSYLNTEKEKLYRTTIWELMNKDYLEGQPAKIDSIMAALGAAVSDANKSRKERKRRRANDAAGAEATKKTQKNKKLSSRINYDVLSQLCKEEEKWQTTQTDTGTMSNEQKKENSQEFDPTDGDNYEEDGNLAGTEQHDCFGDLEEDFVESNFDECFKDGNEEYAYGDLGF